MMTLPRRSRAIMLAAAAMMLAACQDEPTEPTRLGPPALSGAVLDGASGGNPDFFFLPPLVPNPTRHPDFEAGEFNSALSPVVRVCRLDATGACVDDVPLTADGDLVQPASLVPGQEAYQYDWDTGASGLEAGEVYRILAAVGTTPLGFVDVTPRSGAMNNPHSGDEYVFQNGRTLPIRMRIENGALCSPEGTKTCTSATVDLTEGGVVSFTDDDGQTDYIEFFPADDDRVITVTLERCDPDLREPRHPGDGFLDLPVFGRCLTINADPVLTEDLEEAAIVALCGVVTGGEAPPNAVMHQRDNEGDIYALPQIEPAINRCLQLASANSGPAGFRRLVRAPWDAVVGRLAGLVAPRPLHASMAVFDLADHGSIIRLSDFQFALPAQIDYFTPVEPFEGPPSHLCVKAEAKVTDGLGLPVEGARVRFALPDPANFPSTLDASMCVQSGPGDQGFVASTGSDGLASVRWSLHQHHVTHEMVASGRGMGRHANAGGGGAFDSCQFDPVTGHCDHNAAEVKLDLDAGALPYIAQAEGMSDPMVQPPDDVHGHVLFLIAGSTITLTYELNKLTADSLYHLHAFCSGGDLTACQDMTGELGFDPDDHIISFDTIMPVPPDPQDATGSPSAHRAFMVQGLAPGAYWWHINATWLGFERFVPDLDLQLTPPTAHIHGNIFFSIASPQPGGSPPVSAMDAAATPPADAPGPARRR